MNQQTMTIIVTLVCLVMCVGQILMIKQAHENGTSVRIANYSLCRCSSYGHLFFNYRTLLLGLIIVPKYQEQYTFKSVITSRTI